MGFGKDITYRWSDLNGNIRSGVHNEHSRINLSELENMGIIQRETKYPVDNVPLGGALGNLYRRMDSGSFFHGMD